MYKFNVIPYVWIDITYIVELMMLLEFILGRLLKSTG